MSLFADYRQACYRRLLAGDNPAEDIRRREFTLNVLLAGASLACSCATLYRLLYGHIIGDVLYHGNSLLDVSLSAAAMFGLWWLSRRGHRALAAYTFLGCIGFAAFKLALDWSFELPTAGLLGALLIVIAGMVLETKSALAVTGVVAFCILGLGQAQISHRLQPDTSWLNEPLQTTNSVDYGLLLGVIGLVSWLANVEIDRSLKRTQALGQALAEERDSLEQKVAERSRELEQLQVARTFELQRFAEFGRLSAELLHEVANPLTATSLNLQQAGEQQSGALREARRSLRELERYVEAARKQLKAESQRRLFSVRRELCHLSAVLTPLAREAGVSFSIVQPAHTPKLFGDPVKFNQVIANLAVNAIEAYKDLSATRPKKVIITIKPEKHYLKISVRDWGGGIPSDRLPFLFMPFYSSKTTSGRGLGIGLAMVKQAVEEEFGGRIAVTSSATAGTVFTARFCLGSAHPARSQNAAPADPGLLPFKAALTPAPPPRPLISVK